MANMSYCRFQNTLSDFRACLDAIKEDGLNRLSSAELDAARALITLSTEMGEYGTEALEEFDAEDPALRAPRV